MTTMMNNNSSYKLSQNSIYIINQFKQGDFSNYEYFYNETAPIIYQSILIKTGKKEVADSFIADVYDLIYKNINNLTDVGSFYLWADGFVNYALNSKKVIENVPKAVPPQIINNENNSGRNNKSGSSNNKPSGSNKKKNYVWVFIVLLLLVGIGAGLFILKPWKKDKDKKQDNAQNEVQSVEEAFEQSEEIDEKIREIEKPYIDSDGYVQPDYVNQITDEVEQYIKSLYENGEISSYYRGDDYVSFDQHCGITINYKPALKDVKSNGTEGEIWIYEPFGNDFGFNTEVAEDTKQLSDASAIPGNWKYDQSKNPFDKEITVETLKKFHKNQIVLWNGHGGFFDFDGVVFGLNEKTSREKDKLYYDDLVNDRLVKGNIAWKGQVYLATPAFFEYYYKDGDLENSLFYFATCYSMADNTMSAMFLKKGADAFFGSTKELGHSYGNNMLETFAKELFDSSDPEMTAKKAYEKSKQKHGDIDKYDGAQILMFGVDNYSLSANLDEISAIDQVEKKIDANDVAQTYYRATLYNGEYYYTLVDNKAIILQYVGKDKDVVLPESIDDHKVIAVGQKCFYGNMELSSVKIPANYKYVHDYAFFGCNNLRNIYLEAADISFFKHSFNVSNKTFHVYEGSATHQRCIDYQNLKKQTKIEFISGDAPKNTEEITTENPTDVPVAENSEVFCSYGPVVGNNEYIYYWKYSGDSYEPDAMLGYYESRKDIKNQLVKRKLSDGSESVVFDDFGSGDIGLYGDRIIYQSYTGSEANISSRNINGDDYKNYGVGYITAIDDTFGTIIFSSDIYKNDTRLCRISKGNECARVNGRYLGSENGNIYYEGTPVLENGVDFEEAKKGIVCISMIKGDGTDNLLIIETKPDLYQNTAGVDYCQVCQFNVKDGDIYFSYGGIGGTGMVFQGGRIVHLRVDGDNVNILDTMETPVAEYTINDDGSVNASKMDAVMADFPYYSYNYHVTNSVIYIWDYKEEKLVKAFENPDYSVFGVGSINACNSECNKLEGACIVGDYAYAYVFYGVEDPSKSIGWRVSYARKKSGLIQKNLKTGESKVLYEF